METSQTGVPGTHAARLVGLVLKCDLETAPIPHRSTMARTARDLGTRHRRVTQDLVQVNTFFLFIKVLLSFFFFYQKSGQNV